MPQEPAAPRTAPEAPSQLAEARRYRLVDVQAEIDDVLLRLEAPKDAESNAARLAALYAERDELLAAGCGC